MNNNNNNSNNKQHVIIYFRLNIEFNYAINKACTWRVNGKLILYQC